MGPYKPIGFLGVLSLLISKTKLRYNDVCNKDERKILCQNKARRIT